MNNETRNAIIFIANDPKENLQMIKHRKQSIPEPSVDKKQQLVAWLDSKISMADKKINDFRQGFDTDPWEALNLADDVFEAAAMREIYTKVRDDMTAPDSKATLESLREHATQIALNKAIHPRRSTSPCSNLSDQARAAAWADLADQMKWFL